jgi:hypothetical protein
MALRHVACKGAVERFEILSSFIDIGEKCKIVCTHRHMHTSSMAARSLARAARRVPTCALARGMATQGMFLLKFHSDAKHDPVSFSAHAMVQLFD